MTTVRAPEPPGLRARIRTYDAAEKEIIVVAAFIVALFIAGMLWIAFSTPPAPTAAAKRLLVTHEATFATTTASRLASYSTKNQAPIYVQVAVTEYNQAQAANESPNGYPTLRATPVPGSPSAISLTVSNSWYAQKACATYVRATSARTVTPGRCR